MLSRVELMAQTRGRPVVVEVSKSRSDLGAYSFDTGVLTVNLVNGNPNANVATLGHELVHYLQQNMRLPSDLLETEVEAYITDFQISRELGYKQPRGEFNSAAQRNIKKGFGTFMRMLRKQYPEDASLWNTTTRDYKDRLHSIIKDSRAKLAAERDDLAKRKGTIEQMREAGYLKSEIKAYRQDNLPKIDARIVKFRRLIQWARKDLVVLSDPATLREARAYARSVVRRAREFQKKFAHN